MKLNFVHEPWQTLPSWKKAVLVFVVLGLFALAVFFAWAWFSLYGDR